MENKSPREQEQFWLRLEKRLFYSRLSWSSIERRTAFVRARLEAVRTAIAAEENRERPPAHPAPAGEKEQRMRPSNAAQSRISSR